MRVVIVGAGLGGLSAACHIAGRGHEVLVLERESVPGGRAGVIEEDGYRIDTGPTVLTMRGIVANVFAAAGADMADHVELLPVDPMYRASFPGEDDLYVRLGREAMTEEIRQKCGPVDAAAFGRFCDWLRRLYELEQPNFIDRNFDSPIGLARPMRPAIDLVRLGGFRRLANVVRSYFDDHRLEKLFSFQALYAGLSPFDALAIYCVITYMDTVEGVWFPVGGITAMCRGMAEAAEKAGATFRYGSTVERIVQRSGTSGPVTGVRLVDGEMIRADAVVCNVDLPVAYRNLLPGTAMPRVARTGEYSPSCALWLTGAEASLPAGVAHHNIHFGADWQGSFDALLRDGVRQPDPSILVSVPTLSDPALAPDGRHVLYVLEPTPNLDGRVDWTYERDRLRADLAERVAGYGYEIGAVDVERFIDPTDWERMGMERGTPFGLSHRFLQTGPFRPANVDKRVPGLVFVGSGTVPGVSVPMVLVSGRLAAERVEQL